MSAAGPETPALSARKLAAGAGVVLVGRLGGRGVHLLSQVLLARLLGPHAFGLYAIGWTVLRMLGLLAPLGLNNGVIRYGTAVHTEPGRLRSVLVRSLALALAGGVLCGGIVFLAAPWLARHAFHDPTLVGALRLFSLALLFTAILKVAGAATRIRHRMKYGVIAEDITQPAVNVALILLLAVAGLSLTEAIGAAVASFAVAALVAIAFVGHLFGDARRARPEPATGVREMLAFSVPSVLAGVFGMYIIWIDRLLIGLLSTPENVGIYHAVTQTAILFAIVLSAFNVTFQPMIASLYHAGDRVRLEELYKVSTKWGFYVSIPLFVVLVLQPAHVMSAVFGADYASGSTALVILSIAQLVNVGTGAVGMLLIMTGLEREWLSISAVTLVVNVGLNLILIPNFGLTGAALATAIAFAGMFGAGILRIHRKLRMWPYDRRYWKGAVAALCSAGAVLLCGAFGDDSFAWLVVTGMASLLAFGLVLRALGLDAEDREVLGVIARRVLRRGNGAQEAAG